MTPRVGRLGPSSPAAALQPAAHRDLYNSDNGMPEVQRFVCEAPTDCRASTPKR